MQLDVSVVTYNSDKWLENFFQSLLNQSYPCHLIHLYLRDHQSTDATLATLEKFVTEKAKFFASVHLEAGENLGFGAGHNANVFQGKSEFILVSNVDLELEADSLVQAIAAAKKDEAKVACWEFRQKPQEHPKVYHPASLETAWCSSACILFRRSAFIAVQGYDPRIFMYGEDVDLSYRLRDQGYLLKYCPQAVCWHYTYLNPAKNHTLQRQGSVLANFYLRLRFGNTQQILTLLKLFLRLLIQQPGWALAGLLPEFLKNVRYFVKTRKKSKLYYEFCGFNYSQHRDVAYFYSKSSKAKKELPLVTVITRTYQGRKGFLREALQSLLNQTYPNIQVIVVEDGSRTAEALVADFKKLTSTMQFAYFSLPKAGRVAAANYGLAQAEGEYLAFLDDDDLLYAEHIEVLVDKLLAESQYAAVYGLAFEVKTSLESLEPLRYREAPYQKIHEKSFSLLELFQTNYLPIQAVLFRKSLYESYGGMDPSLEVLEDWNLWLRYAAHQPFLLVPKLTSLYRVPQIKAERFKRHEVFRKYYPAVLEKNAKILVSLPFSEVSEFMAQKAVSLLIKKIRARLARISCLKRIYTLFLKLKS